MSSEDNRAIFRRYMDAVVGKIPLDETILHEDVIFHVSRGIVLNGIEAFKGVFDTISAAFPYQQMRIEDMISEGDKVVGRITFLSGPHSGSPLFGLFSEETKGKSIEMEEIPILRLKDGRVAELWFQSDVGGAMEQIAMTECLVDHIAVDA